MQTDTVNEPLADSASSDSPQQSEADPYAEALTQIEAQLENLTVAFTQLDALRAEEAELIAACEQVAAEEKAILENQDATEKQSVDRLLKTRALKDVREARAASARKKLALHVDLLIHDLGGQLRRDMSNLAYALFRVRTDRFQKLFFTLFGPALDHGLMVTTEDLARRAKPVLRAEGLYNWIGRESHKDIETELNELRSELPRRWLSELKAIAEAETTHESQ
jgi:hypothetical protein